MAQAFDLLPFMQAAAYVEFCHNPDTWATRGGMTIRRNNFDEAAVRNKISGVRRVAVTVSGENLYRLTLLLYLKCK